MSYQFLPLTEDELNSSDLLEPGVYDFEVIKSEKKTSKAGNLMAEIQLKIWDKDGKVKFVYDYLVFSKVNLNIRKVKHFCDSVGLSDQYNKGSIPEELGSYCGKAEIGLQNSSPKPEGGYYPSQNTVIDYIKADKNNGMKPLPEKKEEFDDLDIPF